MSKRAIGTSIKRRRAVDTRNKRRETIGTRSKSTVERTLIPTVREGQLVAVASGENHWYRSKSRRAIGTSNKRRKIRKDPVPRGENH
jgi:hypothetical protein